MRYVPKQFCELLVKYGTNIGWEEIDSWGVHYLSDENEVYLK